MNNPFLWLGISILLVAISLIALLTVAILALQELARAARSAEKLLDTLNRELPATLTDLRLTGKELSGLTDEVSGSVQSARNVIEQVDRSVVEAKVQARKAQVTTRSLFAGASAALQVLTQSKPRRRRRPPTRRPLASRPPTSYSPTSPSDVPMSPPSTPISPPVSPEEFVNLPNFSHKTTGTPTDQPIENPTNT
ncbi:DUF948 domain-containing protein [cf. Phormidesmis sp. LEGE 11477]|uniref:DUF948 domain-containing protein n=1 Tax=cf. Phormidesmis sp. LEGE 11477 TaxID=1828680 RepID=UPI00187FB8E7|nr:DUF948 domain-containing protein [cf. Phormidesmis sp. LEGE 11477]MBE9064819.1 DUF948 domain-containing protein [cf. Phormidesmis sp. LEGE 11477]